MKKSLALTVSLAFLCALFLRLTPQHQPKQKIAIGCRPDLSTINLESQEIPLLPGWGSYRMHMTAANDSAATYFQQGINLYYGFHIIEALASFQKSTRFDSTFAMGYWGIALAYGPNINDNGYTVSPQALTAAHKARSLTTATLSQAEKALIDAMQVRYSADTTQSRQKLDQDYVDAMKKASAANPGNPDIAALYADALMQQHPWDLYDNAGQPKSWTPQIVNTLEAILKTNPDHPGAGHYYIHAVEASNHPEKALAVSETLPGRMPGVAHIVHMPAHIYIRTGNYNQGATLNVKAVTAYKDYLGKFAPVSASAPLYLIHNLHMLATCAVMEGRYQDGMQASLDTRNSFDSAWLSAPGFDGIFMQYVYMTPFLTQIRFGKWKEIIETPAIPKTYIYADILSHYGRGIAYARTGNTQKAREELAALIADTTNAQLKAPAPNYANPGINGARVALHILSGVIAETEHQIPQAIDHYHIAITAEDKMIYNEPRDWQQPARQFLGNTLLNNGQYKQAEMTFREDLRINLKNGWSYTGLANALDRQGRQTQAGEARKKARIAFAHSDTNIASAVLH